MAVDIEAARLLTYKAAVMIDNKANARKEASYAKLFSSQAAVRSALEAMQIFGGYGYMKEFPVERLLRDAKVTEIGAGTSEIQKLIIIKE